ncbi:MAG: 30S ribosomal protein S1 [Ruminococcaceae bacterium]|nr:30S ribosomal protein S1 [Oscillospiraceae bacterium]
MQNQYLPEGSLISNVENHEYISSIPMLEKAMEKQKILESTAILCDNKFQLHIDLHGIKGIMPRNEVQYLRDGEETKDIAVLTRVGKPICFKVVGFMRNEYGELCAYLSRRAAQLECMNNYIDALVPGDIIPSRITHMESFGAFVDIGCGIVSLLSIDCISVSRISHPKDRFNVGEKIYTVVKNIDADKRIYVTHRELLGTWQENAELFSAGQTVAGIIRSIESYGIFVELMPNLAGLAELKTGVEINQTAAVYIKSIIPDKMKIKLIVIDTNSEVSSSNKAIKYFVDTQKTSHIDSWRYSPESTSKIIETVF